MTLSAGERLWAAVAAEKPLQVVGAVNAYSALLAERAGFRALYLSGAGVANASFGLPDLGITSLNDVCEDVRRITAATDLPLLVDADTGWGAAFNIARTTHDLIRSGAAGMHLEDQVQAKRCGHRPGKALVPCSEMVDRIKAAVDGRTDRHFVIMARTDAHAVEGQAAAVERALAYVEAGADMIFAEALATLEEYREFTAKVPVPVLANITEFGKTPILPGARLQQLAERIAEAAGPHGHRVFTDSAPVMEVALAQKSGLGWRGKHTLLLTREAGSYFFLEFFSSRILSSLGLINLSN